MVGAGYGVWRATDRLILGGGDSQSAPGAPLDVKIPAGASANEIADELERAGVISSALKFEVWLTANDRGQAFQPGAYSIRKGESYEQIAAILEAGAAPAQTTRLTIPEGYANRDTAALVAENGGAAKAYTAAAKRVRPPAGFLQKDEKARSSEGFLFPDTYELAVPLDPEELVAVQAARFEEVWSQIDLSYARSRQLTPYDVLKIASMVEREAQADEDRAKIAGVIYNRLRARMALGIDATIQYAVGSWRPLKKADLSIDSPYNSRTVKGLPPTPIANPGKASIEAAAKPAKVDFLYYVAIPGDAEGRHEFFKTYEAFLQYQREHPA